MKRFFLTAVLMSALFTLHAYDDYSQEYYGFRYYWSFGDVGISWENITGRYDISSYLNVGSFNWISPYGFGFGFHLFNFEGRSDWGQMLILPAEVNYSPFRRHDNNPIFTFYGRGGWMMRLNQNGSFRDRSGFLGAAGFRAVWAPLVGNSWSVFSGGFIEYTTRRELRVGVSIDVTIFALLWLYLSD